MNRYLDSLCGKWLGAQQRTLLVVYSYNKYIIMNLIVALLVRVHHASFSAERAHHQHEKHKEKKGS
jgi:hypothetical protein